MRLLVVEDSPKMAAALDKGLQEAGFSVDVTRSGQEGERLALIEPYDAIVLDLMLPDHDGLALCGTLRARGVNTPILMLTALAGASDKVSGLNTGADDYLTKPFDFDELVARLRALLRRGHDTVGAMLQYENLVMDLPRRQVTRDGEPIDLTHKEFQLLEYFLRNPDRVLSRTSIGEHVWDMNFNPHSNVVDVYVSMLRRKLDKPFDHPLIHTVVGAGYRFGGAAERV